MSDDLPDLKAEPNELVIATSAERVLVRIKADGTLEYGPEYTPDEAAVEFWTQMAQRKLESDARLIQLAAMERLVIAVARADLAYEAAQLKSKKLGATDEDQFAHERCASEWESKVHQLTEFARGLLIPPGKQN